MVGAFGLDEVLQARDSGAVVLDTRDAAQFASAHLRGSVNIGLVGQYATWAGTVLSREHPIVLIADSDGAGDPFAPRVTRISIPWIADSVEAGTRLGLTVLAEHIQTYPDNFTKFAVIGTRDADLGPPNKTSLVMAGDDRPGSLFRALQPFADRGVRAGFVPIRAIAADTLDVLERIYQRKEAVTGVASGFKKLDELTAGFQPSDLVILAARPSMGKTALALDIARNVARAPRLMVIASFRTEDAESAPLAAATALARSVSKSAEAPSPE